MYDIRIITASGEQSIDMLDASFPLNIESKSIGELDGNRASWSYTITLPRSERNEKAFEHLGAAYVSKAPARSVYECNVYTSNGLRIIHKGLLYINKATATTYEVQIVCGVPSLFEQLRAYDFSTIEIQGQEFSVGGSQYFYGNHDHQMAAGLQLEYVDDSKTIGDDYVPYGASHPYQIPCVRLIGTSSTNGILKHMLQFAVNGSMYKLTTDALSMIVDDDGDEYTLALDANLYATAVTEKEPKTYPVLHPYKILGVKNGLEFMQMIARVLGTIVYVDENEDVNGYKQVYMYTFNHLVTSASKAAAYDWSDKMADGDTQEYYDFGNYTQNNAITQAENPLLSFVDKHIFNITDERKSEDEYKAVDIPTTSTSADDYYPYWENNEGTYKWKGVKKPYLVLNRQTDGWMNFRVSSLIISRQYQTLIRSLKDLLIVQAKFLLTPMDIMQFRPYVPVYLRQYGAYFYVNKISNWEEGKLCEIELIRLL